MRYLSLWDRLRNYLSPRYSWGMLAYRLGLRPKPPLGRRPRWATAGEDLTAGAVCCLAADGKLYHAKPPAHGSAPTT